MSAQMQNIATASEVSYMRESLSAKVAVGGKKKHSLPANFLKFKVSLEHNPFSSNEAHYFDALRYRVMASATDIHRAGLSTCVVTQCWPYFGCPRVSGLFQSSPNPSPIQAGSPLGSATGSLATTRITGIDQMISIGS